MTSIYRRADGMAEIRFTYDQRFVDQLKGVIPPGYRSWNPVARCWIVLSPYVERAETLLRQRFGSVDRFWEAEPSTPPPPDPIRRTDPDLAILHLLPSAPPKLIESAYKCLVKINHPDRGGDHEQTVAINAAIVRLRQRQGVAS